MRFIEPLAPARLIRRYQRFLADVITAEGEALTLHCPNTGSMRNCYHPDATVYYSTSHNPKRRYRHTWELSVTAAGDWIGINTLRANALVAEALLADRIPGFEGAAEIRREVRHGLGSRLDFGFQQGGRQWLCEVKSVTLCEGAGRGYFPDCVSQRALKHLQALTQIATEGGAAALIFCVQHSGIRSVSGAAHLDPAYATALTRAAAVGVRLVAVGADLSAEGIELCRPLPVLLDAAVPI